MIHAQKYIISILLLTSFIFNLGLPFAYAIDTESATTSTADILKAKIDDRNAQIKQLETEINQYNVEVDKAS